MKFRDAFGLRLAKFGAATVGAGDTSVNFVDAVFVSGSVIVIVIVPVGWLPLFRTDTDITGRVP